MDKNIKIILIITALVLLIALVVGGYFLLSNFNKEPAAQNTPEDTGQAPDNILDASKTILPSIQTNPLENKPNLNPVDKTNPIKNIKTNPFK